MTIELIHYCDGLAITLQLFEPFELSMCRVQAITKAMLTGAQYACGVVL